MPQQPRRRHPDPRELIHTLNQRYYREWLRAEQLARELRHARWLGPLAPCLRALKRLLLPGRGAPAPALPDCPTIDPTPLQPTGLVSVIIPFRDRPDLLTTCLRGLRRTAYPDFELVLVDNGSRDPRLLRYLKRLGERGRAAVVSCSEPFNFSRLCNQGAAQARGDYLLFLNNDTEVCDADWLGAMLRLAARPDVGAVGATLLYPDGTIQHAGLFPGEDGRWAHAGRGLRVDTPGLDQVRVVPAVTGACLMLSREVFERLGGFDERLPVTYSDVDLCRRASQLGLRNVVTPHARLLHYEGLTRGFSTDEPGADHLRSLSAFPV
jgi:GT2 family glycosyltransferase